VNRVAPQPACVIAIRVAAGDRIQTLAEQIAERVPDLARLAPVVDRVDQSLAQAEPLIARLEQDRSAVGAAVLLVKLATRGRPHESENRTLGRVLSSSRQKPLEWLKALSQRLSTTMGAFVLDQFMNFSG
jgi:hypothetical protein